MPKLTSDTSLSCSQLPAVMGFSKWSKPNDVLQFCITAIDGGDPRTPAGEAADWGNMLEASILAEMARRLELESWYSPDVSYKAPDAQLSCSLDAVGTPAPGQVIHHAPDKGIYVMDGDSIELKGRGVLESKLTRGAPEESPALYRGPIQVQGQMLCTGMEWAAIGVLYSGVELRIFLYKPHHETQEAILDIAHQFDYKLKAYEESKTIHWFDPIDSKDADRVWSDPNDQQIDLGSEAAALAEDNLNLREQKKVIEETIADNELRLKNMMQEFSSAIAGRYKINWPIRHYKPTPEKIVPAKEGYTIRQNTLTIKEMK